MVPVGFYKIFFEWCRKVTANVYKQMFISVYALLWSGLGLGDRHSPEPQQGCKWRRCCGARGRPQGLSPPCTCSQAWCLRVFPSEEALGCESDTAWSCCCGGAGEGHAGRSGVGDIFSPACLFPWPVASGLGPGLQATWRAVLFVILTETCWSW